MKKLLKWILVVAALTPLIVTDSALVPFVSGKTLYFRAMIAIVAILAAVVFFQSAAERQALVAKGKALCKSRVAQAVAVSYVLLAVSTSFAYDHRIAFFGNLERGEGFVGLTFFYLFFLFTSLFFEKKDWNAFFGVSLASGWVMFLVQFYQATADHIVRPSSLTGNPIYTGAYYLFIIYAGLILLVRRSRNETSISLFASVSTVVIGIIGLFISQDRSVMIGAFVSTVVALAYLAFAKNGIASTKKREVRKYAAAVLIFIALFGGAFVATRHDAFWQDVPGLGRLAQFNGTDNDSKARLVVAEITFRAVDPAHTTLERTLFGWGWDNYIYAWEKNYDPKLYGYDTGVFDRAHDKVLDVLVMTGVLGLIAYLALWALFIGAAIRLGKKKPFETAITLFFAIAFFIQNLTVFDSFVTYLAFFAILACIIYDTQPEEHIVQGQTKLKGEVLFGVALPVIALFSVVAFVFWTLVPQMETIDFSSKIGAALNGTGTQAFLDDTFIWDHNTYAQGIMRAEFLSDIFDYDNRTSYVGPNPLLDKGIAEMSQYVDNNPSRYDYYLALGKANDAESVMKSDPSYLKTAESYYQEALAIIPGRQDVIYPYSINLIDQGRSADAITLLENTLEADPSITESHYRLGEAYAVIGSQDYTLALSQLEYSLSLGFDPDAGLTKDLYQKFMRYYYAAQDLPDFTTVIQRLKTLDPTQESAYGQVLAYVAANHRIPVLNITNSGQ